MVKIVDVSREAGVSPATVSRALNGHPSVGEAYVKRVREAAERLGYRPNSVARNLRRRATDLIALIIPDVGNHFCTAVARGVEDVAREAGYSVLLCNSDDDPAKEANYLRVAEAENVAGVLLCPHSSEADLSVLQRGNIPVVAVDRKLGNAVDSVTTDSNEGAYRATLHLIDQGWQRPACVAGPRDVDTARWRTSGYLQAVYERGLEPLLAHGNYDRASGQQATRELFTGETVPDALVVSNEQMALGVLNELQQRGLKIGVDVGVLTFDDTPWAPLIEPPMTVVAQPGHEIGARAMQLLCERIRGDVSGAAGGAARHIELPTTLVVRGSTPKRSALSG